MGYNYRYIFDTSSKKFNCPKCGKKTFVLYVNSEGGEYLQDVYGKCDRQSKCNYHNAPPKNKIGYLVKYLTIVSISEKSYKIVDKNGVTHFIPKSQVLEIIKDGCYITEWYYKTNSLIYCESETKSFDSDCLTIINRPTANKPIIKPTSYHSLELLDSMYCDNSVECNLIKFLKSVFSIDEVHKAMQDYFITGTNHFWNASTVFWQIDETERIRGGKIMHYDPSSGKRTKRPYNRINWMHKALKENDYNLEQCLFGLHRIYEDYSKTIAITESEKTAIIMSVIMPEFIWLATGNKQNLKKSLLKPIKNRTIILYPDKSEFPDWKAKANEINEYGFRIAVSELIEMASFEDGFDMADYFLKTNMNEKYNQRKCL